MICYDEQCRSKTFVISGNLVVFILNEMAHNMHNAPKLSKKRKLGKNKKKSWRASNVDDIEEYLEDERRQIRTG